MAKNSIGMRLLIVESPAKAKTISKYLGKSFTVRASVGHVRDLPKSNKEAIDIKGGFIPRYVISPGKEEVVSELSSLAKKADEVLLATDPDREGEAIAWHIKEACKLKNPKRIVFHEITKEAVEEAIKHPREIDNNLKVAQEARRVLDRLVGYDLSGLIWKKVRYGLSAGRVQSPALRIIMEREREIRAFKPEDFWVINAEVETKKSKERLSLVCSEEPRDQKTVDDIVKQGKKGSWKVIEVKETEVAKSPRAPFITSTLQQAASSRLGFAPSRTMGVAQKLYEAGLISYMRTDSTTISDIAQAQILAEIEKKFGKEYVSPRVYKTKSKNAQEAHEAIRPTHIETSSEGMNEEQKRLYQLIWQRTIASQMSDAKIFRTKVIANIEKGTIPDFSVNGSRVLFPGWIAADLAGREEDINLPKVAVGDALALLDLSSQAKQTEPPGRYSEAGLVKELEKRGIGRPSTYASIIKTILERGYVDKDGKSLIPTDTGEVVSTFLEKYFGEYISDTFTAEMEDELDDIAQGKREYVKTLKDFYGPFSKDVKSKEEIEKLTNLGDAPAEFRCPLCKNEMIIKLGRTGKFLSCARFPECNGARTIDGKELEGPKETGEMCPECLKGKLVERDGKFGRFVACANYPKCKYIKRDAQGADGKLLNGTGVKCPTCKDLPAARLPNERLPVRPPAGAWAGGTQTGGQAAQVGGEMVARKGRFGIFYSCSNYPKCKNAIKAKPTGKMCEQCGALMMEGTKTIPERCSSKVCPNHNPHRLTD